MNNQNVSKLIYVAVLLLVVVGATMLIVDYHAKKYEATLGNDYMTLFDIRNSYNVKVVQISSYKPDADASKLKAAYEECIQLVDRYNSTTMMINKDMLKSNKLPAALNRVMCEVQ